MGRGWALTRTQEGRIIVLALASRLAVLALMAAADAAFPDLASSAQLQNFPCAGASDEGAPLRSTPLDEMAPWDSVYFVRIAKCGYENDMINAFFPLLPAVMRYGARLTGLALLERWVPAESLYTLVGLVVNVVAFCIAAVALHRLSLATLQQNADLANLSVLLFCFNPASVFYSAVYTEAIFAACTWSGLALLPTRHWAGVAALAAAGAARSNGILACWFLLHALAAECVRRKGVPPALVLRAAASCALVVAPYVAMQVHAYRTYCTTPAFPAPEWCSKRLPSVYGHVQDRYWDVGFLRFYTKFVRWPRVLQSAPVAYLATAACWRWAAADWRRAFTLGLLPPAAAPAGAALPGRRSPSPSSAAARRAAAFRGAALAPYVYHLALMTAVALLVMHVNVATRFLSASPALYWFAALYLTEGGEAGEAGGAGGAGGARWRAAWVWGWALGFTALGCVLFPNFLPWT